jgi:hypothetical protein
LLKAPNAVQGNFGSEAGQHCCALLVIVGFDHALKKSKDCLLPIEDCRKSSS